MNWKFLVFGLLVVFFQAHVSVCESDDDGFVTEEDDDEATVTDEDVSYSSPTPSGNVYLADHFDDPSTFKQRWTLSEAKKDDADEDIAKYDGQWAVEAPVKGGFSNDLGLVLKSKAKHAAISSRFNRVFEFKDKPLVVQYEVNLQEGQECGGAYIKLLSESPQTKDLRQFHDKTPYTIMFGPDKCGNDHKLHFIFRHRNPLNGSVSEKHCKKPKDRIEEPFKDKQPHLYTLVLKPDNTFKVSLDRKVINEGSLLDDFSPAVNPEEEIDDPEDHKPQDWDEREKIPDPQAAKPDDWDEDAPSQIADQFAVKPDGWLEDEPESIADPNAEKPEDWDTEMDGDWEAPLVTNPSCEAAPGCGPWKAPLISNPQYKGKWRAPLIDNPNYKGKWSPRRIRNPDHFEDKNPFRMTSISAVGLELWSMSNMILFDNIIITDDVKVADQWAADSFDIKRRTLDKEAETFITRIINYTHDQPWLWGVYLLALAVPVVLIIVFCCGGSSQEKEDQEREAEAKKTDAMSPDDEPEPEEEVAPPSRKSKSKSQLDQPEEEEEAMASTEDEVDVAASGDAPRSPKKRRPRKE